MLHFKASKRAILASVCLLGARMKIGLICAAAFAAVTEIGASASATILDVQYTGTVGYSVDGLGMFGPARESLAGDIFVANFVFDVGSDTSSPYGYNVAYPMIQWSVTINGKSSPTFGGSGEVYGSSGAQYQQVIDPNGDELWFSVSGGNIPSTINEPFTITLGSNDNLTSGFMINGPVNAFDAPVGATFGFFSPTALTYSLPGAAIPAPEPSTWAMMLLGFSGLGFVGYRRARAGRALAV